MRLEDDIDFTTLNWVKQELDDTLRQARQALEAYVEQSSDQSQLRFCASFLHQVQGTLRMVELYGAAMVVEEMERLVQSLLDDEIRRRDDSYSVLMRGMVQMPDYLERLQGGHKDIPIVLLPLLNDLRACRGEKLLSESVLFAPDLGADLPSAAAGSARALADAEVRQQASRLRTRYQSGLLAWIKNEESEPAITGLIETLDELRAISFDPETRRLWWIAAGLLDAARQRAVNIGSAVKLLFGKVDREIKRMADSGESALVAEPPRELTQNLLYYLAHGAATGDRVDAIRDTYRLTELLPTQAELEHAKGSIGGKNRALLDTVSLAIKEDLLRVKDALDLYLRSGDAVPAELSGQAAVLDRVADTLGMLGLGVPRRVVQEQRRVLDDLSSGARVASEASLLDVAGALLYVEVSLDENIRTLGVSGAEPDSDAPVSVTDPTALPKAEVKRILDALLRESIANVQRAKTDIVAYIESGWEGERLQALPVALEEIVGAMRMLDQHETADLVRALSRFVEVELVGEGRVPTHAQVEHLADAFTSIEYYLEATGESRSGREQILDVTRESLAALGYWPPPSAEELRERDVAPADWSAGESAAPVPVEAEPVEADYATTTLPVEPDGAMAENWSEFEAIAQVEQDDATPAAEFLDTAMPIDAEPVAAAAEPKSEPSSWAQAEPEVDELPRTADPEPESQADVSEPTYASDHADAEDAHAMADDAPAWKAESLPEPEADATEWTAAASELADALPEPPAARWDEAPTAAGNGGQSAGQVDFSLRDDGTEWPAIGDSPVFTTEVLGQSEALTADTDAEGASDVAEPFEIAELPSAGFDESLRTLDAELGGGEGTHVAASPSDATAATTTEEGGFEWIEVEEEVEEDIDLGDVPGDSLPGGFDASAGEDIDDDIREVFIEEVTEEITNIGRMLPALRSNPDDVEALRNVRRSFHTLKGSGRLVGALALGEFSWRVETMLNRVLDRSIPMDSQVIGVLEHSRVALDQLRTELRGMGAATALPRLVMQAADRLVAGEPGVVETTRRVLRKRSVRVPVVQPIAAAPVAAQPVEAEIAAPDIQAAMEQAELEAAGIEEPAPVVEAQVPTGERMPEIEPMLLEVLRSEAGGYLVALESWIEQARDSGNRLVPTSDLLRAVHTLHGALGMVEVPVVAEVVGMLEGYLKRLVNAGRTPNADGLEAMADVSGVVGATLALLDRPGASVPPAGDLNDRLGMLRDDLPELTAPSIPSWGEAGDDEIEMAAELVESAPMEEEALPLAAQETMESGGQEYAFEAAAADEATLDGFRAEAFETDGEAEASLGRAAAEFDEDVDTGAFAPADEPLAAELLGDVPAVDWDMPQPAFIEPEVVEHAEGEFDARMLDEMAALDGDILPTDAGADVPAVEAAGEFAPTTEDEAAFADLAMERGLEEAAEVAEPDRELPAEAGLHVAAAEDVTFAEGMPEATEGADVEAPSEIIDELVDAQAGEPEAAPMSAADRRRQKRKSARQSKREQLAGRGADVAAAAPAAAEIGEIEEVEEAGEAAIAAGDLVEAGDLSTPLPLAASADEPEIAPEEVAPEQEIEEDDDASTPPAVLEAGDNVIESDFEAEPVAATAAAEEWQDEVDPDRPLVLPDLDADLLDIFVEEGREILDQADPVLTQLRGDPSSVSAISAIQRHLHTIKGNARAVGLGGIGDVSHALETLIDSAHGRTAGAIELVQRGFDRLHRMISRVGAGRDLAYPERLIALLEASAAGVPLPVARQAPAEAPAPATVEPVDAITAHDRLALEEDLAPWREPEAIPETTTADAEPVEDLEAYAASEAMLAAFQDDDSALAPVEFEKPAHAVFVPEDGMEEHDLAATSIDFDEMAAAAELDMVAVESVEAAREAEAEAIAESVAAEAAQAEAQPEPEPEPEPEAPAPITNVVRLDDYRLPAQVIATDEAAQRQSQELIRVRADLLDSLVNYAGEVSIYRSRLEQQLGAFRINVVELEQTVERTREQLRKLDIETEAQIIARFQRETEDDLGTFDPLELDRFSNLQQLSRALAESVSDLVSLHGTLDDLARQQETLLLQQSRVASELQQGLMRTRMVPFETQVPFLRRLVRQSADELGKRAQLYVDGAQGEMDRNLLERMKAPLEHMLRNALAHGIETPAERTVQGKAGEGNVRIEVAREASEVLIRVSDDGRGLDREAIRRKAIERGLMRADSTLTDRDLFGFITETGFSTADTVSKLAGRGVGMDVVANEIRELGGSLSIDSEQNQGSRFTIRLPFTLAVTQAIMVRLGEAIFAVPMSSVQGVARLPLADYEQRVTGADSRLLSYGGEEYAVHDLALLLGTEPNRVVDSAGQLPLLLVRSGDQRAAIRVDSVVGSREIVVKSTGSQIASVPGMFGATIMGDGSVVMILDLAPLVRRHIAQRAERAVADELAAMLPGGFEAAPQAVFAEPSKTQVKRQLLVMVVDDSITMRKVTSRVLERNDMEVVTAKDGVDAVEKLQERVPDLAILDIEMPRMDGYELATYIRNDARLRHLPLMMITSRTGEKHRQRAFEIGVDRFLGKPYQEADLLRTVFELIGDSPDA